MNNNEKSSTVLDMDKENSSMTLAEVEAYCAEIDGRYFSDASARYEGCFQGDVIASDLL